jgi:hypothetical protein
MSDWWVHAEEGLGYGESWHGPFDLDAAESLTVRLSKPVGAEEKFAELISGKAGQKGRRIREYYRGKSYLPGESGWHDFPPNDDILIPETA